ncbi:MAG: hypothetical protein H6821_15175 [Planctomycetaceae bacterium]|nr:hypothetical protein [Planctomycetaceae bacterium]MCB9939996.1 hypothetical protein [Planctomycetaceae bacterium]
MLFRLLVIAPGMRAIVTDYIDPSKEELTLKLETVPTSLPPDRMLRGRVVNETGRPVAGALVEPRGAKTSDRRWRGSLPGVDAASGTDNEGRFIVTSADAKLGLDLMVTAPGFAVKPVELLALNGEEHEIRLQRGATVLGSLMSDNKPVVGRAIGIVQRNRSVGQFVGETTLATDEMGQFVFPNLQPNQSYVLYTLCSGTREEPTLKVRTITTGENNTDTDVGDLALIAGKTLAGRVDLPDGAKLPADAKIRIGRDPAWDSCEVAIASDGTFEILGLPQEVFTVNVTVAGFTIDNSLLRFQSIGDSRFALRLREDRRDLVIPLSAR